MTEPKMYQFADGTEMEPVVEVDFPLNEDSKYKTLDDIPELAAIMNGDLNGVADLGDGYVLGVDHAFDPKDYPCIVLARREDDGTIVVIDTKTWKPATLISTLR